MRAGYQNLSESDYNELVGAISKITVLIGNADGNMDQEEKDWAKKVTYIRSYNLPERLKGYYKDVGVSFKEDLESILRNAPKDNDSFADQLYCSLELINPILQQLDNHLAFELYTSFKSFAKHIAKASGGFFGFGSISPEENKWIGLPMLDVIELDDNEQLI